jgi:hypothetical protein
MNKFIAILLVIATLSLSACGSDKVINGKTYITYGLFNPEDRDSKIQYKVIVGNIIWSVLLSETIVAPIYFLGWSLFEPIRAK